MGTIVGLLLGSGVLCIWLAFLPSETSVRASRAGPGERIQDALAQAGAPGVRPGRLFGASCGCALVVWAAVVALTHSPSIAGCFAVMAGAAPTLLVLGRARHRRRALRAVWPEVVDDLVSALRAGMSLPEAVMALADRGPVELRETFGSFARDYRADGRFRNALDGLKARLADPVADRIVEALRLAHEVGGSDVVRLLRTLGQLLREDLRTRGELEARQSWTVNGARLAVAAPWVVLVMLSMRPEAAAAFNSASGVAVLVIGGVTSVLAYWLMTRIGRLPEETRVLR